MANHQFIRIYTQNGDPLQSCQVLQDDQVGYSNGHINRIVEVPNYLCGEILKPSQRLAQWHLSII